MTPAQLLTIFRSEMRDEVTPYLWSDTDLYRYMNLAQQDFCRWGGGIADTDTITLVQSTSTYAANENLIKIRSVQRGSDGEFISIVNMEDVESGAYRLNSDEGTVDAILVGYGQNSIRCIPVPNAADTLTLSVYRMPDTDIVNNTDVFEIPAQHHTHLIDGMAMYAYRKRDAETFDPTKSSEFEASFRRYCDQAKAEREKLEHKPRLMAYAGFPSD